MVETRWAMTRNKICSRTVGNLLISVLLVGVFSQIKENIKGPVTQKMHQFNNVIMQCRFSDDVDSPCHTYMW